MWILGWLHWVVGNSSLTPNRRYNTMSYPSIKEVDATALSVEEQKDVLWDAFQKDLPLGIQFLTEEAGKVRANGERSLVANDPNSPLGKQVIRLLGTDIARSICEEKLGVAFGFYNCCGSVTAPSKGELKMSYLEQIQLQNGVLASADC